MVSKIKLGDPLIIKNQEPEVCEDAKGQLYFDNKAILFFVTIKRKVLHHVNTSLLKQLWLLNFATKKIIYSHTSNNPNEPLLGCKLKDPN